MLEKLMIARKVLVDGEQLTIREWLKVGFDPWYMPWSRQALNRACWNVICDCLRDDVKQHFVEIVD